MDKSELQKLIEDPKVLYIYEIGLQIYGLFEGVDDRDFLLVVNDNYGPDYKVYECKVLEASEWFKEVLNGSLLAWECACLPKKYIHKEYVKLMLETNPLQLRKDFDVNCKNLTKIAKITFEEGNTITAQKYLWSLIKEVMFANQIIENHKILNFKEPQAAYKQIVNGQNTDWDSTFAIFYEYLTKHRNRLKEYTDGILRMSKIKKIKQDV